tara:strand:+ start:229382 stop:230686 length:1305 start_codon:yes stop_codon:yes gene_type:complete
VHLVIVGTFCGTSTAQDQAGESGKADAAVAPQQPIADSQPQAMPLDAVPAPALSVEDLFGVPPKPAARRDPPKVKNYPAINPNAGKPVDRDAVREWIDQLDDDSFRRREAAVKKLTEAGPGVVPYLTPALDSGDLEMTHSVIKILHSIALTQSPTDTSGAWEQLQQLAQAGTGSRRSRSAEVVEEVRDYRSGQARQFLKEAGVFVGYDDFIVRAVSQQKEIVQIDEQWNGDVQALGWLRWLRGIEYARVTGDAIRADVLERLSETVDLNTIALVDGSITPEALEPLKKMSRIHSMEIRYVELDESMVKPIMDLPIRVSLSMKGTGIAKQSVQAMREALPGLQIDCNEGGFLGVTCQSQFNNCQIQSVMPGSAADQAGLMAMDVVVGIDEDPVARFEDLQQAIGMHVPGDKVKVKFRRDGKERSVTVELGKMEER